VNPESNANCSTILRRQFIGSMAAGVGSLAMADLLGAVNHLHPKPSESFICFNPARHLKLICSTTSLASVICVPWNCPIPYGAAKD